MHHRKCDPFTQPLYYSSCNQESEINFGHDWHQNSEDGSDENANAENPFASILFGSSTTRDLC